MSIHVMVDLETLGQGSNAVIIAIGAVQFDPDTGWIGEEFYDVVDPQTSVDAGMQIDVSTVMWWMRQGDDARKAVTRDGSPLADVLTSLREWYPHEAPLWGNGAAFDNVILGNAYKALKIRAPWPYWGDRCYRTLKALQPDIQLARTGTHHHALDDARSQAEHAIRLLRAIAQASHIPDAGAKATSEIVRTDIALWDGPGGGITNAVQLLVRPSGMRSDEAGEHPGEMFVQVTIAREDMAEMLIALDADWADHCRICGNPNAKGGAA